MEMADSTRWHRPDRPRSEARGRTRDGVDDDELSAAVAVAAELLTCACSTWRLASPWQHDMSCSCYSY